MAATDPTKYKLNHSMYVAFGCAVQRDRIHTDVGQAPRQGSQAVCRVLRVLRPEADPEARESRCEVRPLLPRIR